MRMTVKLSLVPLTLWLLMAVPADAQEDARYVVVLAETAAGAGEDVVDTYGGRIERAIDETTVETSLSASRAALMARDPRVQSVTLAASPDLVSTSWTGGMSYEYDAAGNVTTIGSNTFVYDHVDRLVSDTVSGVERQHAYDAFGNRTACADVTSESDCQGMTIAGATNRVDGATYDEAGSLKEYSAETYTYDAVGMLIQDTRNTAARKYIYSADDERIAMIVGTTWYWTLRDFSGKVLREMTSTAPTNSSHSNWQWTRDNVWRDGQLLSSRQPTATSTSTFHYHLDHLGTPRVVSTTSGTVVGVHEYAAFGTEQSGNAKETPESRLKFTGHERDSQDGAAEPLDYMHARYYDAMWGRFLSVDPTWESADLGRPQSWNRYAYVVNDPANRVDPTGKVSKPSAAERARRAFWGSVDTGVDLADFLFGTLPADSAGTADEAANLAKTPGMESVRDAFVANGCEGTDENGKRVTFSADYNYGEFGNTRNGTGHMVGGFNAYVRPLGNGTMLVYAFNYWGRESASRLPKELGGSGAPSNRRNPSIQDMINGAPRVWPPKSVLNNVSSGFMATVRKNYIWTEPLPCGCN